MVKSPPAVWETWVRPLGWEDPLEKEMATHSRILAWRITWAEEPGGLQSLRSQRVWHNRATDTLSFSGSPCGSEVKNLPASAGHGAPSLLWKMPWRRKWQAPPLVWPGESHGQRSLVGYTPRVAKRQDWSIWACTRTRKQGAGVSRPSQLPLRAGPLSAPTWLLLEGAPFPLLFNPIRLTPLNSFPFRGLLGWPSKFVELCNGVDLPFLFISPSLTAYLLCAGL